MEYIGKICPYCRAPFKPGDDIVVCSACGMPHHKECWIENQACTTFGCQGTISNAGDTPTSGAAGQNAPGVREVVYCTKCGTANRFANTFCFHCGNRLFKG